MTEQASRERMWTAVDQLTLSSERIVLRDDGTVTRAAVPSLWQQAVDATTGKAGEGNTARTATASERNLVDLDLVAVRNLITGYTSRTLHSWRVDTATLAMPAQLRTLASASLIRDRGALWWWEYRFSSWARMLTGLLSAGERHPAPLRLRNSACPQCSARQVTVDSDDGPVVVPALLVDFRDATVRAAECTACGATWWRGDDLLRLAQLLAS